MIVEGCIHPAPMTYCPTYVHSKDALHKLLQYSDYTMEHLKPQTVIPDSLLSYITDLFYSSFFLTKLLLYWFLLCAGEAAFYKEKLLNEN